MTSRLRRFGATVSVLALLGAGAYAGSHLVLRATADRLIRDAVGQGSGVMVDAVQVEPLSGRIAITGLVVSTTDGRRITVGSIVLQRQGLVSSAFAAENFTVNGLSFEAAGAKYTIPRIDVVGGTMTAADVRAIFDGASATPMSVRMARLSAESIAIPEITATATQNGIASAFVYRDVRLFGLAAGVVRSLAISGGTFESRSTDQAASKGEFGPMAATAIDLPWIARAYTEKAGPNDTVAKVAYATFSVDGLSATTLSKTGDEVGKASVGRIVGKDFRLRPSREPWLPIVQELATKSEEAMQNLPPEDRSRLVNAIADMMEASEVGLVEATDLRFSGPSATDGAGRIGRMSYSGAAVGRPAEMRMEGMEFGDKDTQVRVGTILHTGFSFASTFAGLRETLGQPDFDPADFDMRKLIPELGTFAIRDVDIRTPARKGTPAPTRLGLKTMEISATEPINGIPTALRIALDRLTMDIPPSTSENGLKDLIALGYKDVDVSMGFEARWREADNDLSIGNVSVQGVNMGGIVLRGTVGNVTRDVFAGDATMAQIALFGATVKQVALTIDNRGLFERVIDREARKQKKTHDQLRKELGGAAQMMIPAFLGSTPSARAVAAAVAKFVARPNRLVVTAKAKNPMGIGAADVLMNGGNPGDILAQIDLTAVAE
jgi:hypothetical protein